MAPARSGALRVLVCCMVLIPAIATLLPAKARADGVPVFSDQIAFAVDAPGPALLARGYFGGGSISGLFPTGEPGHLMMVTPPGDALVGRRLDILLQKLPFLTWNWRRLPPDMGQPETLTDDAPMRLIVGFTGGIEVPTLTAPPPEILHTLQLPPFQRALVVTWSNAAWESGAADRRGPIGHFIAHGGPADGQWWEQTVDLAQLHARLWPEIRQDEVKVAWVAVGLRASSGRSLGEVAGLALMP